MSTPGYSGTPLVKKLGIKTGMKILLLHAPTDYFSLFDTDISQQVCSKKEIPDLVHLFATDKTSFLEIMIYLEPIYTKNTSLVIWVSWYKKSSGIPSDITEDIIRNYALQKGLVDIKVCAVTHQWSGLKLVVPVAKRKK